MGLFLFYSCTTDWRRATGGKTKKNKNTLKINIFLILLCNVALESVLWKMRFNIETIANNYCFHTFYILIPLHLQKARYVTLGHNIFKSIIYIRI